MQDRNRIKNFFGLAKSKISNNPEFDTPSMMEMGLITHAYPQSNPSELVRLLLDFPDEILVHIISFLPPHEIARTASQLNRRLHSLCTEYLFKHTTPAHLRFQIGFFRNKQIQINDMIDEESENRSSCKDMSVLWGLGALCTTASGYAARNLITANRAVSRDEQIIVAVFLFVSLAILLSGIFKSVRHCMAEYNINRLHDRIEDLNDEIEMKQTQLKKHSPSRK
jgi:hypothetical protein